MTCFYCGKEIAESLDRRPGHPGWFHVDPEAAVAADHTPEPSAHR